MKKAAVGTASLIMALLIASCASSKAANVTGKKVAIPASLEETGMEAVENGTTAAISFDANATTGYSWDYTFDDEGIIEEKSSSYDTDAHSEGIVGYGGRQHYAFKAVRAGSTTARFKYRRPWDPDSEVYRVSVDMTADAAGNIHITAIY